MRAWSFESFGLDHLELGEHPDPDPGPGQVRLRLHAASLNYRDLMMVQGTYNPRLRLPLVPCSDGVGIVDAVGEGVTRWAVGDRICPLFSQTWIEGPPHDKVGRGALGGPLDGTLREAMVIDQQAAVAPPAHLTDEEAACLPCAGVTAWRALVTEGGLEAGGTALALGTGGVSLFALQIAHALGAKVAITSSSDAKLDKARALGADFGVNYVERPTWGRYVVEWTEGRGVDVVVEVGGAGTIDQSLRAVRVGGTVVLLGVLSGGRAEITLGRIFMRAVRVQGVFVGNRTDFEGLVGLLDAHPDVRPVVDRVYAFEEVPDAFHSVEHGAFGKIVVRTA